MDAVHFRWGQMKRFIWITPHHLELKLVNCSTRSISSMRCTRLLRMVFGACHSCVVGGSSYPGTKDFLGSSVDRFITA